VKVYVVTHDSDNGIRTIFLDEEKALKFVMDREHSENFTIEHWEAEE